MQPSSTEEVFRDYNLDVINKSTFEQYAVGVHCFTKEFVETTQHACTNLASQYHDTIIRFQRSVSLLQQGKVPTPDKVKSPLQLNKGQEGIKQQHEQDLSQRSKHDLPCTSRLHFNCSSPHVCSTTWRIFSKDR